MQILLYILLILLCALGALIIMAFKLYAYTQEVKLENVRRYSMKVYEVTDLDIVTLKGELDIIKPEWHLDKYRSYLRYQLADGIVQQIIEKDLMHTEIMDWEHQYMSRIRCEVRMIPKEKNKKSFDWNLLTESKF